MNEDVHLVEFMGRIAHLTLGDPGNCVRVRSFGC